MKKENADVTDSPVFMLSQVGAIQAEAYELGKLAHVSALANSKTEVASEDYWLIAHLIGIIFFAGNFKAETANERQLEALLVKNGHRYKSWEEIDAAPAAPIDVAASVESATKLSWKEVNRAATAANEAYGQFMPERWVQYFVKAYNKE